MLKNAVDSQLKFRQEVEKFAHAGQGKISTLDLQILEALRLSLGVLPQEAIAIKKEVIKPYQDYNKKLLQYQQALAEAIRREYPFTPETRYRLERLQEVLGLQEQDITALEMRTFQRRKQSTLNNNLAVAIIGLSLALLTGIGSWLVASLVYNSKPNLNYPQPTASEQILR